jgi:hypothetical protein
MHNRTLTLFSLMSCVLALAGCEGAQGASQQAPVAGVSLPQAPAPGPQAVPPAEHKVSRNIDSDYDADGIADYRIAISETFDASGNLIRRIEDADFEADGIVDARTVTNFGANPVSR